MWLPEKKPENWGIVESFVSVKIIRLKKYVVPPESTEYPISPGRINSSELIYLFHQHRLFHLNYLVNVFKALINSSNVYFTLIRCSS